MIKEQSKNAILMFIMYKKLARFLKMSYSPYHNPTKEEYENQSASLTRKLHFGEVPSFVQGHASGQGRT